MKSKHRWTAEEDALLGTRRDRDIASLLSIHKSSVGQRRRLLGVRSFQQTSWHFVSEVKSESRTGLCSICGPVGVSRRGERWDCSAEKKARDARARAKYRYGLSKEAAEELRASPCEACGGVGPNVVDHCHTTGEVRGSLCGACNSALGWLGDDTERVRGLLEYITRTRFTTTNEETT